jgi:DnaJ-class molecular chaperone
LYDVLGVPADSPAHAIKRSFRALARKHHPDKHSPTSRAREGETFRRIAEAWQVLGDEEQRWRYDAAQRRAAAIAARATSSTTSGFYASRAPARRAPPPVSASRTASRDYARTQSRYAPAWQ